MMPSIIFKTLIFGATIVLLASCSSSVKYTESGGESVKRGQTHGSPSNTPSSESGTVIIGKASYYGEKFHGRTTANGEKFDMYAMTAAHKSLPFGTVLEVVNLRNGKKTKVRVNDRGPFVPGRVLDLSKGAAEELDMISDGVIEVEIRII
ncbi:MAG: hypothetical protein Kapaf2KO_17380 [Candidatus Kapaibacteriales bacterium]